MLSLKDKCLLIVKHDLQNILKTDSGKSLLNIGDNLLESLAEKYSNSEAEALELDEADDVIEKGGKSVHDARNEILSFIYRSLIISLMSEVPETHRGNYWSLFAVYKCRNCQKLIQPSIFREIICNSLCYTVNRNGALAHLHEPDIDWNLTDHINHLKTNFNQNWRLVYWFIWLDCHYLHCNDCHFYFPLIDHDNCRYHPDEPMFDLIDEEGILMKTQPVGIHICCKSRAYRYECSNRIRADGCKRKCHQPDTTGSNNNGIMETFKLCQPVLMTIKNSLKSILNVRNIDSFDTDYEQLRKTQQGKCGLLDKSLTNLKNQLNNESTHTNSDDFKTCYPGLISLDQKKNRKKLKENKPIKSITLRNYFDSSLNNGNIFYDYNMSNKYRKHKNRSKNTLCSIPITWEEKDHDENDSLYNDGCCLPMQDLNVDENYFNRPIQYSKRTSKHKRTKCGLQSDRWVNRFSTRYNQDKQREFENAAFCDIVSALTKRLNYITPSHHTSVSIKSDKSKNTNTTNFDSEVTSANDEWNDTKSNWSCRESTSVTSMSDDDPASATSDHSSSYCSTLKSSVRIQHSRTTSVWNSYVPLAGSYVRIETEVRDEYFNGPRKDSWQNLDNNIKYQQINSSLIYFPPSFRMNHAPSRKQPTYNVQQNYLNRKYAYKAAYKMNDSLAYTPISKTKTLEMPLKKVGSIDMSAIWCFDSRSQELDYLSAAYMPLPITYNNTYNKYYKGVKNELTNEWASLVDLEKSWNAFLCLFFETEPLPNNVSNKKYCNTENNATEYNKNLMGKLEACLNEMEQNI